MGEPKWTTSQQQAIGARKMNLLVSAGAGSGKTTVLTQRIIQRIEEGDSVTDFLVVTFTKASAADLKSKLYDAISRLAAAHPEEKRYRAQLYLLSGAQISTIHSYCLEVVRSNFQTLGISPTVRMADEEESRMLAVDVMDAVTDAFYESEDAQTASEFALLADTFSGTKDDGPLAETMLGLYHQLRAYADYFGWLEEKGGALLADAGRVEDGLFSTSIGARLQEKLVGWFDELTAAANAMYQTVEAAADSPKCLETAEAWCHWCGALADAAKRSYRAFSSAAEAFAAAKFPRISYGKMPESVKRFYGAERDRIKKETEKLLDRFVCGSEAEIARQFSQTGRILLAARTFLGRFEELYAAAKREKGMMDFSDAEHFLLRLLEQDGQPTPLCLSLRQSIREIYIDEYQDVSPLQDRLFTLLSDGSNRFMVGDVKQSIYRFRNAYPDIFLDYKDSFADYPPPSGGSARIFLRENFRSGQKILDFTNLLFRRVTAGTAYEREYKGEELVFAKPSAGTPLPVTVAVSPYDDRSKTDAVALEAAYLAEEILSLTQNAVRETEAGKVPYRYGDVVLLFRALKGATKPYEQALRARGIPFTITTPEPFFDQPEILLVMAVLKAVDDPTDDISLFAVMRSPIAHLTAQELYEVRQAHRSGPLVRAVQHAAEGAAVPEATAAKCTAFLAFLAELREEAQGKSCHAFLWGLYLRSGLLQLCTRKEKKGLLLLYEYARRFETTGYQGLSGFLSYLKTAQEKGVDLPGTGESGDADCVTLTTIHKSKGLEYPVVFLCNCDRALFPNLPKPYTLLREEGLFFKLRDYERLTVTDTLLNRYAGLVERDAELGEELRKLYVACTRAREKLYISGSVRRKALESASFNPRSPQNLMDLVLAAADAESSDCYERIVLSAEEIGMHMAERSDAQQPGESFWSEEVEAAIRFVYPAKPPLPAKVSVSELKQEISGTASAAYTMAQLVRPPAFLGGTDVRAADAGTANHLFLQFCRFDLVEQNGIRVEADRLVKTRMLREEQAAMLDEAGLLAFFSSNLYARMCASRRLYREQRFSVRMGAEVLGGDPSDTVLLQGVIDCFFEEADGSITVVDYKTDRVKDDQTLRTKHAMQLSCYRRAVEAMLGVPVARVAIWSFALNREVVV